MFFKLYIFTGPANVVLKGTLAGVEEDLPLLSQVKEWQEIYRLLSEGMRDKSLSSGHNHTATTHDRWCQLAKKNQTNPKTRLVSSLCRIVFWSAGCFGFRHMRYTPDGGGGRWRTEKIQSQISNAKCEWCTSMVFTCCVLGHRSFIIIVRLLKYWRLPLPVHGSDFKPFVTLEDFLFYPCRWL